MRVSLPITITSCILVVIITWWIGTRGKDFMAAPSEAKLSQIRQEVERSMPATDQPRDAVSAPNRKIITSPSYDPNRKHPLPVINPSDLKREPDIDEYLSDRKHGPDYLVELAELLEMNQANQRAYLCWERVLDSTKCNDEQSTKASKAINQLRSKAPSWNSNPDKNIDITLNIGTDEKTAKSLQPTIQQIIKLLEQASSGILKFTPLVITGEVNNNQTGAAPAAVWITGANSSSNSTEILSFGFTTADIATDDVTATIYRLIRGHLSRNTKELTPPRPLANSPPTQAIRNNITRLHWQKFGQSLNSNP